MLDKRNALIICDSFLPYFAPRMSYLAYYLESQGWSVDVVTTKIWDDKPIYHAKKLNSNVYRCEFNRNDLPNRNFLIRFLYRLIYAEGEMVALYKSMLTKALDLASTSNYNVIISSSAYSGMYHRVAFQTSKEFSIPWISDFRDIFEQYPPIKKNSIKNLYNICWRKLLIKRRNNVIKHANAITTVSESNVRVMEEINHNCFLIYNGYDADLFYPEDKRKTEKFQIIFGGKVYADKDYQDPEPFFAGISLFIKQNPSALGHFFVTFYCDEKSAEIIHSYASKYNVTHLVEFKFLQETKVYADIMRAANLAVLFANPLATGVIPTKFYEYAGSSLPILVIPSDGGEIASLVNELECGATASNANEVMHCINKYYANWNMNIQYFMNEDKIQRFTREKQSSLFLSVIASFK
jgi:glycosyltransferase involved in cell wall biosynthesis